MEIFENKNNTKIKKIRVKNKNNLEIEWCNLGARITKIMVPFKKYDLRNIILTYDNIEDMYTNREYYYGSTIGRVAGRIAEGKVLFSDCEIQLSQNEGLNHIHGGREGLDLILWDCNIDLHKNNVELTFSCQDYEGHNGYPGNMDIKVKYIFDDNNNLRIEYYARTDKETIFNPTNHTYFNLNGNNSRNILNHYLWIDTDEFAPVKKNSLPIGILLPTKGTVFDFKKGLSLCEVLLSEDSQLKLMGGIDHTFKLNKQNDYQIKLYCKDSPIKVFLRTSEPAVTVYSHNKVNKPILSNGGLITKYSGLALEPQIIPDSVHFPNFGNIYLSSDKEYRSWSEIYLRMN